MSKTEAPSYLEINDDSVTVTLKCAIDIDGATVSALTMREPTVEDNLSLDAMKGSDAIKEITYFANLCNVAPSDIRKLTQRDYTRLQAGYKNFMD